METVMTLVKIGRCTSWSQHESPEKPAGRLSRRATRSSQSNGPSFVSVLDVPVPALMVDDASGWVTSMNPIASELFGVSGLELKDVRLVDLLGTDATSTDPRRRNTPAQVALPLRGAYEVVVADDAQATGQDRARSVVMLVPSSGQANGQNGSSRV